MNKLILLLIIGIVLLVSIVSSYTPSKNFYLETGEKINSTTMEWLLYNTDLSVILMKNHTFTKVVGEFELSWTEEAYLVSIIGINNKTHKPCIILRFLREHPEILLKFPELEATNDNIATWRIDGVNCLKTSGGSSNQNVGGGGTVLVSHVADSTSHLWQTIKPHQIFSLKSKSRIISINKIEVLAWSIR